MLTSLLANLLGLAVTISLFVLLITPYAKTLADSRLRRLFWLGFATRVLGSCGMYVVIVYVFKGGDALMYVEEAQTFRDALLNFDFVYYLDPKNRWLGNEMWWGSQFIVFICSFTSLIFGSLILPQFFVFSMAAFSGLWFLLLTFRRVYPQADWYRLAVLVLCLPSVWFWSSSVGKEAIIMMGAGLAYGGLARLRNVRDVAWMAIGLLLIFTIRPQVAAVAGATMAFGYLAARWRTLRPQTIVFGAVLIAGAVFVAARGAELLGLESAGVEGAQSYVEFRSTNAEYGETAVEGPGTGWASIPGGFVNILFRPFPWEVTNFTSATASLEIVIIWAIVLLRSGRTLRYLRLLVQSPLFVASAAFVGLYAALLGMVVFNMGIITRQRVVILPLLLLLVHFIPRRQSSVLIRRQAAQVEVEPESTGYDPLLPRDEVTRTSKVDRG